MSTTARTASRKAAGDFRRLIDRAIEHGGSYFLTYHRWASRAQVEACHPRMVEFLRHKRKHDPGEVFQSDWYRHYRQMFADHRDLDPSASCLRTRREEGGCPGRAWA